MFLSRYSDVLTEDVDILETVKFSFRAAKLVERDVRMQFLLRRP